MQRINEITDYLQKLRQRNPENTITNPMKRESIKYIMAVYGATKTKAKEYLEIAIFKLQI
jgi:hypothetical protein